MRYNGSIIDLIIDKDSSDKLISNIMETVVSKVVDLVSTKPTALIPIADGCEEMEVAGISDALARGGIHVTFASVGHENPGHVVKMMNGVMIQADKSIANCIDDQYDLIVLPGGRGAKQFRDSEVLVHMLKKQKAGGKYFGGICAAPVDVLYHHALLDGPATCYPRYSDQLGKLYRDKRVVVSGKCVTSQGPGTAMEMGLKLVELLRDTSVAKELAYSLLITK